MYTIDYYKEDRVSFLEYLFFKRLSEEKLASLIGKRYLECLKNTWNIKSLTIDSADLRLIRDTEIGKLGRHDFVFMVPLCNRLRNTGNKFDKVTIYNSDMETARLINKILNTKWLVNKDDCKLSDDVIYSLIGEISTLRERLDSVGSINNVNTYARPSYYRDETLASDRLKQLKHYIQDSDRARRMSEEKSESHTARYGNKVSNVKVLNKIIEGTNGKNNR